MINFADWLFSILHLPKQISIYDGMVDFTDYSVLMALLSTTAIVVFLYFARKSKYFTKSFDIEFMVTLYLLCILRMFVPVEFPLFQYKISDRVILPPVMNIIEGRSEYTNWQPLSLIEVLIAIWIVGFVVFLSVFVVKQIKYQRYISEQTNASTDNDMSVLNRAKEFVFKKRKNITLLKTDAVSTPMTIGLVKHQILLPDIQYTDTELEYILIHECTHIKNHDLWIKLLSQICCCVYWWNPVAYWLKKDLGYALELKCDRDVIFKLDSQRSLDYVETVVKSATDTCDNNKKLSLIVGSGFSLTESEKTQKFKYRILNMIGESPSKLKQGAVNTLAVLLAVFIVAFSYLFIWQASYPDLPPEEYEVPGVIICEEEDAYLVEQEDGSYKMYWFDEWFMDVSKEEFEEGGYEHYRVKEYKR